MANHFYAKYYAGYDVRHGGVVSVPHVLLALLSEGPKYGLQLREEFEAGTGEVWPLNVGQVYKTLGRLERDGLAESDGTGQDGPQMRFRISKTDEEPLDCQAGGDHVFGERHQRVSNQVILAISGAVQLGK